jgi:hypothetical protein
MLVRQVGGTLACSKDCGRTGTIIWLIGGDISVGLGF